jgi:hypothetical protein
MNQNRKLHPAGKDFIINQLIDHNWSRSFTVFGIVYFFSFLPIVLSIFSGNFINDALDIEAFTDYSYHVMYLILLPFFVIFIPYYLNGLEKAIDDLHDSQVVQLDDVKYAELFKYANEKFASKTVTLIPYLFAILFIIFTTVNYNLAGHNSWDSSSLQNITLVSILAIFIKFLFYYFFCALLIRIVLTYFVIHKLFDGNVNVQPLHPDNCGGLSPLGEFALRITWAGIGIGIPVVILVYVNVYNEIPQYQVYNTLNIAGYIIAMCIVFFLPLLGARKCMLVAKSEELKRISDSYQIERRSIFNEIHNYSPSNKLNVSNLEGLMKLYEIARLMPVWPFNSKNIIRFLSSVLWPLLLVFLQIILEKL